MVGRKESHQDMLHKLESLQGDLKRQWLDRSLPQDWNALDHWHPVTPDKTRVTLRLDTDMLRWFRKLGKGYQSRINDVLRVYWTALLSGEIQSHFSEDTLPQILLHANEVMRELESDDDEE